MRPSQLLIVAVVCCALAACSGNNGSSAAPSSSPNPPNPPITPTLPAAPTLLASGGTSTSGSGGTGGYVYVQSNGGAVKVLKAGTVDATFTVPTFTQDLGINGAVVSGGITTVLPGADDAIGNLCTISGDTNLYIGNGSGTCDSSYPIVTGLMVEAGATLVLVDQGIGYATLRLMNDLVIKGTLMTDMNLTSGFDIEANIIYVESGGKIITSATTTDWNAGEIWLGNGNGTTKQIINRGTIEAKGLGSGSGGWLIFEPDDLVVNTGIIDASGGESDAGSNNSGGSGGELDVYVDYGDFYSSGIVRMNGGKGDSSGGDSEAEYGNYDEYSAWIETALKDNTRGTNGKIIISGTWEAHGGDGTSDRGGVGGYINLQTDALGSITINAAMSVKGGGSPGASGGNTYGIDICSYLDPYGNGGFVDPTPGKIRIAGQYDLRGGSGDGAGGSGGYFGIYSDGWNASYAGPDVELIGFALMNLNGGDGINGGGGAGAFHLRTISGGGVMPAGPITNEAKIEAMGGKATGGSGYTGGAGGYGEMQIDGIADPGEIINNSGSIDISGGTGDTGGSAYAAGSSDSLRLKAVHVANSGDITANGGNGTSAGGTGGNITLTSNSATPSTNTGTLSVAGGTPSGGLGIRTIDGTVL